MKTKPQPTQTTVPSAHRLPAGLITKRLGSITLHYGGNECLTFARHNGAVELDAKQIDALTEGEALLLILLSGAKEFFIEAYSYNCIREGVWFHLDRERGGLTAAAEDLFADDLAIVAAAALHREAVSKRRAQNE